MKNTTKKNAQFINEVKNITTSSKQEFLLSIKEGILYAKEKNLPYTNIAKIIKEIYKVDISISTLRKFVKSQSTQLKPKRPKIQTIYGETKLYPLNTKITSDDIRKHLYEAPQIQIVKIDNLYYVATNQTTLQNLQSLYILNQTDSQIPQELQ